MQANINETLYELINQPTPMGVFYNNSQWGNILQGRKVASNYKVNYMGRIRRVYRDTLRCTNYAYNYILLKGVEVPVILINN